MIAAKENEAMNFWEIVIGLSMRIHWNAGKERRMQEEFGLIWRQLGLG